MAGADTDVEDVRRILLQVRQQYDAVRHEAETKDARLRELREAIRAGDTSLSLKGEEWHRLVEREHHLEDQLQQTRQRIMDTQTSEKVYKHMLARIQKEQAILKEKMLMMEEHMARKRRELQHTQMESERIHREKVQALLESEALEQDKTAEREAQSLAREQMEAEQDRRKEMNKRRTDFEAWRHEVALEAANEAFNASAGRLRKLYAIEKLQGNCLQKITYEQMERSQTTERGFQKIRDVTGLTDVMDIVHKFLNRDVEQEQLKTSVKDAELRLEDLRREHDGFKQDTEGITIEPAGRMGDLYKVVEEKERELNDALKEHEMCRMRLQKKSLQVEHIKRWATRVGQLIGAFAEPVEVKVAQDMPAFFRRLDVAMHNYVVHVGKQIGESKVTRKVLSQVLTREHNEQGKLLANESFLRANCRVQVMHENKAHLAESRPVSVEADDEHDGLVLATDRKKCKEESDVKMKDGRQAAEHKKRQKPQ